MYAVSRDPIAAADAGADSRRRSEQQTPVAEFAFYVDDAFEPERKNHLVDEPCRVAEAQRKECICGLQKGVKNACAAHPNGRGYIPRPEGADKETKEFKIEWFN